MGAFTAHSLRTLGDLAAIANDRQLAARLTLDAATARAVWTAYVRWRAVHDQQTLSSLESADGGSQPMPVPQRGVSVASSAGPAAGFRYTKHTIQHTYQVKKQDGNRRKQQFANSDDDENDE